MKYDFVLFDTKNTSDSRNMDMYVNEDLIALKYANDIGLLDYVSILLACVSIILVIGGVFAFINIKSSAKKEARETAEQIAEKAANDFMQSNIAEIIESYRGFIGDQVEEQISTNMANQIAQAQEDRSNDKG